jgi:hypothetical protein
VIRWGHNRPRGWPLAGRGTASHMENDEIKQQSDDDRVRRPNDPPEPRGNPESDRDAVEKAQDQLNKISGN